MKTVLVTGGAGFLGTILVKELIKNGYKVVSIDLEKDPYKHKNFTSFQGDIRSQYALDHLAKKYQPIAIFHLAAQMPHAVHSRQEFWRTNFDGTRNVAETAKKFKIKHVIFTSTNCLWGKSMKRPITEADQPRPREIYGRSKLEGENILKEYSRYFRTITFRCPPIIDVGRAGNIAILFEFIRENRKLWMVGKGKNRYQMLYAHDLIAAMLSALNYKKSATFHIGSDNVPTFRETYEYIIKKSGSSSRPASFPAWVIRPVMQATSGLGLHPLGPYFQEMIDKDFAFDTTHLQKELAWRPTLNNSEMLLASYRYFQKNYDKIKQGDTNNTKAKMGIIKLLKWMS